MRIKRRSTLNHLGGSNKSPLANHTWEEEHRIKWEKASTFIRKDQLMKGKLKTVHIQYIHNKEESKTKN